MKFEVLAKGNRFFVNGKQVRKISGSLHGGYRYVGKTQCGHIFKADIFPTTVATINCLERQTENEIYRYVNMNYSDLKYFPKILDHGTYTRRNESLTWLIQEYIDIKPNTVTSKTLDIIKRLSYYYSLRDYNQTKVGGRPGKSSNWCVSDSGHPIIYDFGYGSILDKPPKRV